MISLFSGDEADDKYDNSHSSPGGNNGLSFDNSHLTIGNVHKAGNDKPISNVVWNLQQAGQNNGDSATVTSLDKKVSLSSPVFCKYVLKIIFSYQIIGISWSYIHILEHNTMSLIVNFEVITMLWFMYMYIWY